MNIQLTSVHSIIPYARNPRKNDRAVLKVMASIKEFGFQSPIIVDKDNVIIAGHTRFLAAKELGLSEVPVSVATGLTDTQVKAYRIADNKVAEYSEWDHDLLKLEFEDLRNDNFDIDLTGFSEKEIESLDELGEDTQPTEKEYKSKFEIVVECKDELDQEVIYQMLTAKGYKCRVLSI